MASSLRTKLRIAASVVFASGFFDAVCGRFLFQRCAKSGGPVSALEPRNEWRDLAGAVHVHSTYSDGAGDVPTVMEAARRAGVDWLLLSDHNTQRPLRDGWQERYEGGGNRRRAAAAYWHGDHGARRRVSARARYAALLGAGARPASAGRD
jgi:hypothetical protein